MYDNSPREVEDLIDHCRALIYAVVVLESLLWFSFVALILGMPKPKAIYRKSGKWIDGICGAIFGAFGAALVWAAVKEATR